MIYTSERMAEIDRQINKVADSQAAVFITGQSGTGKELIADLLHSRSQRATSPIVRINCAALPTELVESELFGSVKGAFTGAYMNKAGLFSEAGYGTLVLDELTEMPIKVQSKLLRVLQEKQCRPVGGTSTQNVNCRVIATSNRDLKTAIKGGFLREDLYYRLSVIHICLPTLNERVEDIPGLVQHFVESICQEENRSLVTISSKTIEYLQNCRWPGNIRQLYNELYQAILCCDGDEILPLHFLAEHVQVQKGSSLNLMEQMERDLIMRVLRETENNKLQASKRLGLGRQTLYNKIKTYGIEC